MSILDEFSISALFFVCPGLVDLNTSNLLYPLLAKNLFKISCEIKNMNCSAGVTWIYSE